MNITRIESREECLKITVDDTYNVYLFPNMALAEMKDIKTKINNRNEVINWVKSQKKDILSGKYEIIKIDYEELIQANLRLSK